MELLQIEFSKEGAAFYCSIFVDII